MIKKYSKFQEKLLEKLLYESIVYFSPNFRKIIKNIDSPITQELKDIETQDIKNDVTFIDVDEKEGYASFKTMKNVKRTIDTQFPNNDILLNLIENPDTHSVDKLYNMRSDIWKKSRNPIAIGRLINSIFPGKFNNKDLEEFINKYKSKQTAPTEHFQVIEGDLIHHWYQKHNYLSEAGQLGNSCMRSGKESWFKIYTENPEVCKMLILLDEDSTGEIKLKGRALLWKVSSVLKLYQQKGSKPNENFEWFLDRQYTIYDSDTEKMREYAKEKGWAYKSNNSHSSFFGVIFNETYNDMKMEVQLGKANNHDYDYEEYPYLDTFRRYDPSTGVLYNDADEDEDNQYILDDTGGGYSTTRGSRVWSDYHDDYLDEDDAIYSDSVGTYINREIAVEVSSGSRINFGWYPSDDDNIVYDNWNDEYIHIDDSIYSDYYGYYILSSEAELAIIEVNEDGDVVNSEVYVNENDNDFISLHELDKLDWFSVVEEKWDEYSSIYKSLLTKYNGEWILKAFQIKVFKLEYSIKGIEYLTEIDSEALGIKIDKEESKLIDKNIYNKEIKSKKLVKRLLDGFSSKLRERQLELDLKDSDGIDYKSTPEFINREKMKKRSIRYRIGELEEFIEEMD